MWLIYGFIIIWIFFTVFHGLGLIFMIVDGYPIRLTNVIFQCILIFPFVIFAYRAFLEREQHVFKREKRKNYKRLEKKFGSVSIVKDVKAELKKNNYADFDVKVYNDKIETCGKTWFFSKYDLMDLDECLIDSYDLASYFGYCVPFEMGCRVEALKKTLYGTGIAGFNYNSSTGDVRADYDSDSEMVIGHEVIGDNYKCDEIFKKPTKQKWG